MTEQGHNPEDIKHRSENSPETYGCINAGTKSLEFFRKLLRLSGPDSPGAFPKLMSLEWIYDHFDLNLIVANGKGIHIYLVSPDVKECFKKTGNMCICCDRPGVGVAEVIDRMAKRLIGMTLLKLLNLLRSMENTFPIAVYMGINEMTEQEHFSEEIKNSSENSPETYGCIKAGPMSLKYFRSLLGLHEPDSPGGFPKLISLEWIYDHFDLDLIVADEERVHLYLVSPEAKEYLKKLRNMCVCCDKSGVVVFDAIDSIAKKLDGMTMLELLNLLRSREGTFPNVVYEQVNDMRLIRLSLISKCDWNCIFCSYDAGFMVDIGRNDKRLISNLQEWTSGCENFRFMIDGKEPLNYPRIYGFLEVLARYGKPITVNTTSRKIVDTGFLEKIEPFRKLLIFDVPIYGARPETHDEITGMKGSYEYIAEALKTKWTTIKTHTLIVKNNLHELGGIKRFCDENQIETRFNALFQCKGEKGAETFKRNAVRISDMLSVMKNEIAEELDLLLKNSIALIPTCISGYATNGMEVLKASGRMDEQKTTEHAECRHKMKCRHGEDCMGIFSAYLEMFGDSEFRPVE